jgi:hypothetical protein
MVEELLYGLHISVRNSQEKHKIILLPVDIEAQLTTKEL